MYQEKEEKNKGITLISLVLTIIILLILVGVSLSLIVGETGIVERASKTKNVTETAELQEKIKTAAMAAQVEGLGTIPSIEVLKSELDSAIGTDYTIEATDDGWTVIANKSAFNIDKNGGTEETEYFDSEEWDLTAADEDCFYWASDDPTSDDYGTVIGYKEKLTNYSVLRFPSRTTKILIDYDLFDQNLQGRSYIKNIKKIELSENVIDVDGGWFENDSFENVEEINIPKNLVNINRFTFENSNLKCINVDTYNPMYTSLDGVLFDKNKEKIVIYPRRKDDTVYIIPNTVKIIGEFAFTNCNE